MLTAYFFISNENLIKLQRTSTFIIFFATFNEVNYRTVLSNQFKNNTISASSRAQYFRILAELEWAQHNVTSRAHHLDIVTSYYTRVRRLVLLCARYPRCTYTIAAQPMLFAHPLFAFDFSFSSLSLALRSILFHWLLHLMNNIWR